MLQYAYQPDNSSPTTRAFVRLLAKAYGEDIPHPTMRSAVLAFAASMLPVSEFGYRSEFHIQEATTALLRGVTNPAQLEEADIFAAGMLMWTLWIINRPKDAMQHALGSMSMFKHLLAIPDRRPLSDMLTVFGPLVFADARFYGAIGLDSPTLVRQRVSFKERVRYQRELILCGGPAVPWLSAKCQALIDALWELDWILLSYLLGVLSGTAEQVSRLPAAMGYIVEEFNDPDLQHAFRELENWSQADRSNVTEIEEEVMNFLCFRKLSIDLMVVILCSDSVIDGLLSFEAYTIAKQQLSLGRLQKVQRDGLAHETYTWAYAIDLGLCGLAIGVYGDGEGM